MTATRTPFSSASPPPVGGPAFLDQVKDNSKVWWDTSCLPMTNIGGTPNDLTADVLPDFDPGGLVDNMSFRFSPVSTNTGGMTIGLNSQPPAPLLFFDGTALTGGEIAPGSVYEIVFWNGNFALMNGVAPGQTVQFGRTIFTGDGTWIKPAGLNNDRMIFAECWGAGGGGDAAGNNDRGGGGGGYISAMLRAADLPASVIVSIGVGGGIGADGTATTFGSFLTAGGGQKGGLGTGFEGQGGAPGGIAAYRNPAAADAMTIWHGGSGARAARGGHAVYGGAGGGATGLAAGVSQFGGNGGANGAAGSAPGGGGGEGAPGARGECRVTLL